MNIRELISTLTKLADENPGFADKHLTFIDRDNTYCDVENLKLLDNYTDNDLFVDLGGQYLSKEEEQAKIDLYRKFENKPVDTGTALK